MSTVYTTLGPGLQALGWDVLPVWAGILPSPSTYELPDNIEILAAGSGDLRECAIEFVRWVTRQRCDIIVTAGEQFVRIGLPALQAGTRVVAKCPAQSRHAYRLVTADLGRTDLILVETKRQYEDLTKRWGVSEGRCALIANGIRQDAFRPSSVRDFAGRLRLVYTGRLDEATKHVMLLPEIGRRLANARVPFEMRIAGDGPERARLQRRIDSLGLGNQIALLGAVPRERLPELLGESHVAVIPSRLDGMSWALLESMACGCVPIVSLIHRTTDMVVRDGRDGFLCRMGDAKAFAEAIRLLADDRARLRTASEAARQTIAERFTAQRMIDAHDHAFAGLLSWRPKSASSISLADIKAPRIPARSWRSCVPRAARNFVRTWAQRFGVTV